MSALLGYMERQSMIDAWCLYMAQLIGGALGAKPFAEIVGIRQTDTRSGQEIVDDLIAKMRKRKEARQ